MKRTCYSYRTMFLALLVVGGLTLLVAVPSLAQPSLSLSVGANAPFALSTTQEEALFRDLWPIGFQGGLTLRVPVKEWVRLDPKLTYRIYPYDTFHRETFDETQLVSSSGQPMQQLYLGLGVRLQEPTEANSVAGFAQLNLGYEFERDGQLTLTWQDQRGTQSLQEFPANYQSAWAFGVELGVLVPLSRDVSLQPSVLWHGSSKDRNYALLAVEVSYAIPF